MDVGVSLGGASGKEPTCQSRRQKRPRFHPWIRKSPWRRAWQPTPAFLPRESHGQRSLTGDIVHRISKIPTQLKRFRMCQFFPVAQLLKNLPAIQETQVQSLGQEDPLEKGMATHSSSCLEHPMDRGAWQTAVHGIAKSQT